MTVTLAVRYGPGSAAHQGPKGLVLGVLVCILLTIVHLFLERLGLFFIAERQTSEAVLELESVKEHSVLVV